MAEKNNHYDFPPADANAGYDDESRTGPSAPPIFDESSSQGLQLDIIQPSAPPYGVYPSTPPDAPPLEEASLGPPPMVYNPPSLVFEDIYDACTLYVKNHRCYGSRFINRMKLTEIINKGVYHYKLESFGEKRTTTERDRPYNPSNPGPVNGPNRGRPPKPWEMTVDPPAVLFQDSKTEKIIPHTDAVRTCCECNGRREVKCPSCDGNGKIKCSSCSGRKKDSEGNRCLPCSGSGKVTCSRCDGRGKVKCPRCLGLGKLLHYQVLIVIWKNHASDFISNMDDLPAELILKAGGVTLLENQDFTVPPILNAPDESVNAASVSLMEKHMNSFRNEMIIRQRHVLRAFPFTRVKYNWKERDGEFYVYGTDRIVYFEDYPQSCCCCTCC